MQPSSIKKTSPNDLTIVWNNGHQSKYGLDHLRNICPCAGCQGETILLQHYSAKPQNNNPKRCELIGIEQVGSYAIQLRWGDGHNTGIYTWEYLLLNCQCEKCFGRKKVNKMYNF